MRAVYIRNCLLVTAVLGGLAGCTPAVYDGWETDPVTVKTAQGPVVCQLYSKDILLWDRSVEHPAAMDRETADATCHAEGVREKAALEASGS